MGDKVTGVTGLTGVMGVNQVKKRKRAKCLEKKEKERNFLRTGGPTDIEGSKRGPRGPKNGSKFTQSLTVRAV